jgi:hypothetical protein
VVGIIIVVGWVRGCTLYATDLRKDFADVRTTIFLNPQGQAHKTELRREISGLLRVKTSLNTGLE